MSAQHPPTVLVVNDDSKMLDLLVELLTEEGYKTVSAANGTRALQLIEVVKIDTVICDVVMPGMDGLEVSRKLKEDPQTANVPILLVSALQSQDEAALKGLESGADDFLEIPFRHDELRVKVARLIERKRAGETLRASEEQYRILFQSNPHPMWVFDDETYAFLAVNDAAIRHYGYSREEFLGMTVKDIRPPDDIPVLMAGLAKRRTHDMVGIRRHRKKDGTLINVEITWHSLDFEGRPARLVLASDVTERKNAEAALRESEESYRELFENANDIIYTHDLTGNFTSWNKAGEKITGYTREEASRMNIADVLAPDYVTVARQMLARKAISEGATVYELEIIAKGGERVALEVSTRLVYRDNVPVAVQGIGRDITDRKRTQDALRETQSFFHTFMNNSPAIAFLKDEAGRYVYVNEPFERLFGQKLEFLRGRTSFDWLEKATARQTHDNDLEVLTTGQAQEIVETVPTPDGTPHHWLVFKFPTTAASGQKLVGGVGVDITERRLAEQALSQQAEREAMTNRISQAVRRSLDLGEVFHTAVSELGAHLEVDRCSLFMRNDKSGVVTNVAEFHVPEVMPAGHDFEFGEVGSLVAALEKESALIFNDVASDPGISDLYQRILREADVRSIMYVAIRVGDETPAAFALSTTKQARRWSESDIAIAKAVADQTGIAIRQAKLYQSAEATSTRETLANSLSLAIRASLSLPEVLSAATRELGRALSASRVHWRHYDSENGSLPLQHEYVAPGCSSVQHIDVDHGAALGKHLLNSLSPLIVDDALNCSDGPPEFASYIRETAELLQLKSQIVYPVVVDGQFRGALCIDQADRVRCWTEDEVALVGSVAVQLAIGIAQAELFELVARAKKEWESTFDAMSDGIFIFERTGRLMRVNRAGAAFEQLTPQLLSGRHCCDILRTSADDAFCIVEKAIAESRSVTLEIVPIELNRPLLVTVEPIFARDGQTAGAVCTARDVTELRKIEAVAREQQSLLTNILESARESIYAVDAAGRFQWCNSATLKGLGCRREDFIGANLLDLIHEEDRHMVGERFVSALAGQPQTYEMRYFSADGNLQYARVDNAPLVVEGRTTGVLGIARDITAQKQERERAARADKLRALGQLASGVAHDFNNSLAAILGRAQLMRRHLNDEASIRNLDVIQTAAEDAAATVRRIQTFARKTHAKEFELLDVSQLVSDAVEITRTRWENEARLRGLNIDVSVNAGEALFTHGNASELREVFVNLIVNAVDAMPHGGNLTVDCSRAGERLNLRFCDTGTGMEEGVRQKVFEPFYTTKGMQGTGLGLAVSYGIIERHEGLITVESKLGHGTTFVIDLPVAVAKPAVAVGAVEAVQGSLSVLVVDDELFVRETLTDMLSELSHRVVGADCGRAALAEFTSQPFDLVFTDLAMPEMDGWATARALRKLRPEVPVVMVTGYGATAEAPDGEPDLISGVIGKPFDFLQVSETIARVIGKQTSAAILPLLPV